MKIDFKELLPVILGVIKDWRVIVIVVTMILVIAFTKFIVNYEKKPKRPKLKKKPAAAPAPKKEAAEGGEAAPAAEAPAE